jgi:putative heme transporter
MTTAADPPLATAGSRAAGGDPLDLESQIPDAGVEDVQPGRLSLASAATRAWQLVGLALAAFVLAWLVARLRIVVVACLLAFLLAAAFGPVVLRLRRIGWRRTAAAGAVTAGWVLVLLAVLTVIGWRVAGQIPALVDQVEQAVADLGEQFPALPIPASGSLTELAERVGSTGGGEEGGGEGDAAQEAAITGLRIGAEVIGSALLAVVLSFFLLRDGDRMWAWFTAALGPRQGRRADRMGRSAYATVAQYLRGLVVVASADAALSAVGLFALGVPLAEVLAVLTFFAAFVPTVGAFVVGGLAVLLAAADGGIGHGAVVALLYVGVQQLDGSVLQPWVMGRRLPLHPAVVLLALAVGGVTAGMMGALLGVPLAAALVAATHAYLTDEPLQPEPRRRRVRPAVPGAPEAAGAP